MTSGELSSAVDAAWFSSFEVTIFSGRCDDYFGGYYAYPYHYSHCWSSWYYHQILHTHGVDQQLHALVLDLAVAVLNGFVKRKSVLEPRATAARYKNPEHQLGIVFLADQFADLIGRRVGKHDWRRRRIAADDGYF